MVDQAVCLGVFGGHKAISVGVFFHRFKGLARVVSKDFIEPLLCTKDFLGLNANIGRLALGSAQRLVNHDPGVGQAVSFPFCSGSKQNGSHAGGLSDAVGVHLTADVLHRVVNGQARGDVTAWGVNIDADVFFGVLHLQEEKLSDDRVGHAVINRRANEDNPIFEEAGVDIVGALSTPRLFNDARDKVVGFRIHAHVWNLPANGVLQKKINGFSAQKGVSK